MRRCDERFTRRQPCRKFFELRKIPPPVDVLQYLVEVGQRKTSVDVREAETRAMAVRDPNNADSGDDLLTAIYEAERGLNNSIRLVQRAAKQGRL